MARILVVDDDLMVRSYVAQILQTKGHTVEKAENGEEGLAIFRSRPTDLIITDMAMPKSDGVQLIASLQKENPSLPIIAMSGAPDSAQFLFLASYFGAEKMLTKPFTADALIDAVDLAVKRSASSPSKPPASS